MVRFRSSQQRSHSGPTPTRASTRSGTNVISSHPRFGEQLDRNGVVFARSCVQPPADLDELLRDLDRKRESKSPSECEYRAYVKRVDTSYNEDTMTRAFDFIAKSQRGKPHAQAGTDAREYVTVYNLPWTESNASVQEGISNPQPDVMEAFTTASYPAEALEALGSALAPTKHPPAMPSLVVHAKGPKGSMDEAKKQCAYDGAVMVHAAHQTHAYLSSHHQRRNHQHYQHHHPHQHQNLIHPPPRDATQALTLAFNGHALYIHAHHRDPRDGRFHCYPLAADQPHFDLAAYRRAARRLRNARDWGRARAERTCEMLWERARRGREEEQREWRGLRRGREEVEAEEEVAAWEGGGRFEGILTPPPGSSRERKRLRR